MSTEVAEKVMKRISEHGDYYHALFSAALDEVRNPYKALTIADQCIKQDPDATSRFAKAGDPDDCGHERPGDKGGKFTEGNTCAGEGSGEKSGYRHKMASSNEQFKSSCNEIFGKDISKEEILDLCGHGSLSSSFPDFEPTIVSKKNYIGISYKSKDLEIDRYVDKNENGDVVLHNNKFFLSGTGSGLGATVFVDQVKNAIKSGVKSIVCTAGKDKDMNGYYTWPRFGYDGKVDPEIIDNHMNEISNITGKDKNALREDMENGIPIKVSEFMKTQEGRDFWKKNGEEFRATFDLSQGSLSRRVLSAYLKEKGKDSPDSPDRFRSQERITRWQTSQSKANSHQNSQQRTSRLSVEPGNGSHGKTNKKEFKEGSEPIPRHDKVISAHQVGEALASQWSRFDDESKHSTPEQEIKKWVSSSKFYLMDIPVWSVRVYDDVAPKDHSYSTGPVLVDYLKDVHKRRSRFGSFGSLPDVVIIDGKHRRHDAMEAGKKTIEAYVGDKAYDQLKNYILSFAPIRKKFVDTLNRFYESGEKREESALRQLAPKAGLDVVQINDLISKYEDGILFDPKTGEFEDERSRSRFAKAGDPDDCGHERPGDKGGKFTEGNTCAGEGGRSSSEESGYRNLSNEFNRDDFIPGGKADKFFQELSKKSQQGWDEEGLDAIREYTSDSDSYYNMNYYMRNGRFPGESSETEDDEFEDEDGGDDSYRSRLKGMISEIKANMLKNSIGDNIVVYRGINIEDELSYNDIEGKDINDLVGKTLKKSNSFISTSLSIDEAASFASDVKTVIKFNASKDSKAVAVGKLSDQQIESEVLFNSNYYIKINSIDKHGEFNVLEAELIDPMRSVTKSRFAKAGDCGHDEDGDFSKGNTCAGDRSKRGHTSQISSEERKQIDDLILETINEWYGSWRERRKTDPKHKEPELTATFLRDYLVDHGRCPKFIVNSVKKQQDILIRSALERLRSKGEISSSTSQNEHGQDVRAYEPKEGW